VRTSLRITQTGKQNTLSLVAAFARLAMTVVMGINLLPYFIALLL
jgi:hypothetical protein